MSGLPKRLGFLLPNLFTFWIIATTSICVGLLLNQFRDKPLPLVYQSKQERLERAVSRVAASETPKQNSATVSFSQDLSLDEFRVFVKEKHGLILDARPEIFHRFGRVPGALSLPREDFEKSYARLKTKFEADKSQPIAVYCSNSFCEDSKLVRKALVSFGYSQVAVFQGGWAAWTQAGLAEEKTP